MATIEPRLIHLLNDSKAGHISSDDLPLLPPLQSLPYAKGPLDSVLLPPLGLELNARGGGTGGVDPQAQKLPHVSQVSQVPQLAQQPQPQPQQQIPSLSSATGEDAVSRLPAPPLKAASYAYDGSAQPKKANHSLLLLLEDGGAGTETVTGAVSGSAVVESSHSLRMILDDPSPELPVIEDLATKKRHRALTVKDDFVQLPQPLKKQKSAQQVMPPIINGLHEPPPNAAVFPPMSAVDFGGEGSVTLNPIKEFNPITEERHVPSSVLSVIPLAIQPGVPPVVPSGSPVEEKPVKPKRKATKPRRKWTELETNHLLLGVSRHGVGKWTNILEDPDFHFNDRTAGDLKDRFRTCCPDELRANPGSGSSRTKTPPGDKLGSGAFVTNAPATATAPAAAPAVASSEQKPKAKRSLMLETILIGNDETEQEPAPLSSSSQAEPDSAAPKPVHRKNLPVGRKSRAHRKKLEDLVELGICGPFKKSHRRERRPFTEQDDKEILAGIYQYGPAWTKIQRDENYNLSSRQPTDLRDRVRNKYPEIYAKIEKGSFRGEEQQQPGTNSSRSNNLMEPTVNTTIEYSLNPTKSVVGGGPLEPHLHRPSSKEKLPKLPPLTLGAAAEPGEVAMAAAAGTATAPPSASHSYEPNNDPPNATFMGSVGWMDISRLLLDDNQMPASSVR